MEVGSSGSQDSPRHKWNSRGEKMAFRGRYFGKWPGKRDRVGTGVVVEWSGGPCGQYISLKAWKADTSAMGTVIEFQK